MKITNENYQKFKDDNAIIILAFKATWCGPCDVLTPILKKIEDENDRFAVGIVDVDEEDILSAKYGLRNIPTVHILLNGETVNRFTGIKSEKEILDMVNQIK